MFLFFNVTAMAFAWLFQSCTCHFRTAGYHRLKLLHEMKPLLFSGIIKWDCLLVFLKQSIKKKICFLTFKRMPDSEWQFFKQHEDYHLRHHKRRKDFICQEVLMKPLNGCKETFLQNRLWIMACSLSFTTSILMPQLSL